MMERLICYKIIYFSCSEQFCLFFATSAVRISLPSMFYKQINHWFDSQLLLADLRLGLPSIPSVSKKRSPKRLKFCKNLDTLSPPLPHFQFGPRELRNDDGNGNENVTRALFHLNFFAIISTRSTFTKMANYPGTKLVGVAYKLRKKMKNSPSCVHVLHKALNVVISRCRFPEDGKEMYQNANPLRGKV